MNLLLFEEKELDSAGVLVLTDDRARHLVEICKVEAGDSVRLGVVGGRIGRGRVISQSETAVELAVDLADERSAPLPVIAVIALPRPQMAKRIIELVGTLGIERLLFIGSQRVEKSFFHSPLLADADKHPRLGMAQGMTTFVPQVDLHRSFTRLINEELPEILADTGNRLLAHLDAHHRILDVLRGKMWRPGQRIVFAVGPEGGWVPKEVEAFERLGFLRVALSSRTLRVDTAVSYALAQIEQVTQSMAGIS